MSNENDKDRAIRQGPVFERISSPEDADRYKHKVPGAKPPVGKPSVGPTDEVPQPEPSIVEEPAKAEVEEPAKAEVEVPVPPEPNPKMEVPGLSDLNQENNEVLHEAKEELREVAKEVAAEKYQKPEAVDTVEKALMDPTVKGVRWGIIGSGQAGGRLAEQFFKFGYPACVINTARQDMTLLEIPEENKFFMDYALGGAGKDMSISDQALVEYQTEVYELMRKSFGQDVETVVICIGGGGGTGSGSAINLVKMVARFGLPVVVLYTLPQGSEGATVKANAIRALDRIARLSAEDTINALIIVDNSKIEQLYPTVSAGQFWKVANFDIVNTLNMFNTLCRCDTNYDSLDPMDFVRIFSTGNCTIYGKIEIPIDIDSYGHIDMYEDELAMQVLGNLQSGLLAEGFDLQESVAGGIIITGREEILDQIPAVNINYMYHQLNGLIGDANIYRGLYKDNNPRNSLTIYTILSGLGLPQQRVETLLKEAQQAIDSMESKAADKSKMVVDTQPKTTSGEQQIYEDMKQRGTAFGRLAQKRGKRRSRG